jgi:hypothetical protein
MSVAYKFDTASAETGSALVGKLAIAQARIEKSFLEGGNVLIAVMEAVGGLTEILDGLVNLLDPQATAQVFDGMKTVAADLSALPGIAGRKQEAFGTIATLCNSVYGRVEDMREIIRYLRTIAVTVKITGAGIPEFSGFADEIRERIQSVSEEIARFADQLVAMRNRLSTANSSSEGVIRDFASTIPLLVENMDRSSVALAEQQKRMAATARELKQITGSIQSKIASVLSGLQIGDVTRQRIEHVMSMISAIEDLKLSEEGRALDGQTMASLERAVGGLAHAQLDESLSDFQKKCGSISATIASFTVDAAEVLSLRDDLAGQSRPGEGDALETMKHDLARATDLSAKVAGRTQDLDQVVDSVGESTQALISGIATIRKIKLDIFYMALNSNLACTRLGDAGRSVNVASGELRNFADKLEVPAEGIVVQMQEIEAAKDMLTQDSAQPLSSVDAPLEHARSAVDKVADGMSIGLEALQREGGAVFSAIEEAIRKLDFRSDLGEVLEDCLEISAGRNSGRPERLSGGVEIVDRLSANIYNSYTMAQERAIHERFLPVSAVPAAVSFDDDDDDGLF